MTKILNEGLDYLDLEGQMMPIVSVDEYSAKMGKDSEIITLAFTIKNKQAGKDLSDWFERGYDFVLDAQVSDGEVSYGKYLVFVEMNRRSSVPSRIIELLSDLETLTDIPVKDWTIVVDEEEYEPVENILAQIITISPHEYRIEKEQAEELNDLREMAGLETKNIYDTDESDEELKKFKTIAGL